MHIKINDIVEVINGDDKGQRAKVLRVDHEAENRRLKRELARVTEVREILKNHPVLREPKAVRFRFVQEQRGAFPVDRLCRVMNVSPRGLRTLPINRRARSSRVNSSAAICR